VRLHKPNASPDQITNWLNWRIRQVINMRPYWAGLIARGVINIPGTYTTGTVTTAIGSTSVTGVGTSWPISDVVNTTLANAIVRPGMQQVTPVDMTNITDSSLLYIGGGSPEVVAVTSTTSGAFVASFNQTHLAGDPVTCSSLAGQQFKPGFQNPIFTVMGVASPTSLILDLPWAGPILSGTSYTILKMYYTFATDIKDLLSVIDPRQGIDLVLHYPLAKLNDEDVSYDSICFVFPVLQAMEGYAGFRGWTASIHGPFSYYCRSYLGCSDDQDECE
jgi:hypothetical protein